MYDWALGTSKGKTTNNVNPLLRLGQIAIMIFFESELKTGKKFCYLFIYLFDICAFYVYKSACVISVMLILSAESQLWHTIDMIHAINCGYHLINFST